MQVYKIVADLVAEGLTEPEVAAILAPELRMTKISEQGAHSWRAYTEISAESRELALEAFKAIVAAKCGELWTLSIFNETAIEK